MTTATRLPPNVEVYLEALRAELSDLAAEEREDLLSEVEPSLLEAAAAGTTRSPPGSARRRTSPPTCAPRPGSRPRRACRRRAPACGPCSPSSPARRACSARARRRPSWPRCGGRLRAVLAVGAVAVVLDIAWSVQWPFLPRYGSVAGTVVVALAALAGSCALGLRARRGSLRRVSLAVSVAALLATPFVVDAAGAPAEPYPYDDVRVVRAAARDRTGL